MSKRVSRYLSIEASEEESSYDSDVVSEDLDGFAGTELLEQPPPRRAVDLFEKYKDIEEFDEEEVTTTEFVPQTNLLPQQSSPRLFIVRCKVGKERDIAIRIFSRQDGICSVIQKDGLMGYIYVEAFQKQNVVDSVTGLHGVYKDRISVVPADEMVDAMTYKAILGISEFGRIKKGKYKNDLVQVIENFGEVVKVRIVPRIDGVKRLFRFEDHTDAVKSKDVYIYKKDIYSNGFLEKEMLRRNIDFDVEPTLEELEVFQVKRFFSVNDRVRVVKGEMVNYFGVIEGIRSKLALVKGINGSFEIPLDSLEKTTTVGAEVSVNKVNGVVVKVEGKKCIVAVDNFTEEIEAEIAELQAPVFESKMSAKRTRIPRPKFDAYINKQVQIGLGKYKGYYGVVKDVYKNSCRVQLNSNMKFVSVDRNFLNVVEERGVSGHKTPVYRTPGMVSDDRVFNHRTSTYKTPGYKTPGYKTPGYKTPGYKTPGYKTPGYKTPGYEEREGRSQGTLFINDAEDFGTEWLVNDSETYKGTLINVDSREIILEDLKDGSFVTREGVFNKNEVEFIKPKQNDSICVLSGEYQGVTGVLITVNGDYGVVRAADGPLKNISMSSMSKKMF